VVESTSSKSWTGGTRKSGSWTGGTTKSSSSGPFKSGSRGSYSVSSGGKLTENTPSASPPPTTSTGTSGTFKEGFSQKGDYYVTSGGRLVGTSRGAAARDTTVAPASETKTYNAINLFKSENREVIKENIRGGMYATGGDIFAGRQNPQFTPADSRPARNFSFDDSGLSGRPQYSSTYGYSTPTGRTEIFYSQPTEKKIPPSFFQDKANRLQEKSFLYGEQFRAAEKPREQIVPAIKQAAYGYGSLGFNVVGRLPQKGKEFATGLATGAIWETVTVVGRRQAPRFAGAAIPVVGAALGTAYFVQKGRSFAQESKPIVYEPVSKEYYARRAKQSFNVAGEYGATTIAEVGGFATGSKLVSTAVTPAKIEFTRPKITSGEQKVTIDYSPQNIGSRTKPFLNVERIELSAPRESFLDVTPSKGLFVDRVGTVGGRSAKERSMSTAQRSQRAKPSYQPFRPTVQDIGPGEKLYSLEGKGLKPLIRQGEPVTTKYIKTFRPEGVSFEPAQIRTKDFVLTSKRVPESPVSRPRQLFPSQGQDLSITFKPTKPFNFMTGKETPRGPQFTNINNKDLFSGLTFTEQKSYVSRDRMMRAPGGFAGPRDSPPIIQQYQYKGKEYITTDIYGGGEVSQPKQPIISSNYPRGSPQWRYEQAINRLRSRIPTGPRGLAVIPSLPKDLRPRSNQPRDIIFNTRVERVPSTRKEPRIDVSRKYDQDRILAQDRSFDRKPIERLSQERKPYGIVSQDISYRSRYSFKQNIAQLQKQEMDIPQPNEQLPLAPKIPGETTPGVRIPRPRIFEPFRPTPDVPTWIITGRTEIPPPPRIPPPPIPALPTWGLGSPGRGGGRAGRARFKYVPSLTAGALNIRGPKPKGFLSPVSVRPIIEATKKRLKR